MERSDFDSTREWFRFVRQCGRDAFLDGEPREAPFRDFDECDEWNDAYDGAKAERDGTEFRGVERDLADSMTSELPDDAGQAGQQLSGLLRIFADLDTPPT